MQVGIDEKNWAAWRAEAQALGAAADDPIAVVDVARQVLVLDFPTWFCSWPVSTAAAGVGSKSGSLKTPPGWHRVCAWIGDGEPTGRVFRSREPAERVRAFENEAEGTDLILTRILWLDGLEKGVNRGRGIDSKSRYIYIHGTNQEQLIGQPASHGCIRMRNADVLELFDATNSAGPPRSPLWVLVWDGG